MHRFLKEGFFAFVVLAGTMVVSGAVFADILPPPQTTCEGCFEKRCYDCDTGELVHQDSSVCERCPQKCNYKKMCEEIAPFSNPHCKRCFEFGKYDCATRKFMLCFEGGGKHPACPSGKNSSDRAPYKCWSNVCNFDKACKELYPDLEYVSPTEGVENPKKHEIQTDSKSASEVSKPADAAKPAEVKPAAEETVDAVNPAEVKPAAKKPSDGAKPKA